MEKSKRFIKMFVELGNQWRIDGALHIDGALEALLEENVCSLSMVGKININEVRYTIFKVIY